MPYLTPATVGYIIGPLLVPGGIDGKAALERLFLVYFVISAVTTAGILAHFPARPAVAPSRSSALRAGTLVLP